MHEIPPPVKRKSILQIKESQICILSFLSFPMDPSTGRPTEEGPSPVDLTSWIWILKCLKYPPPLKYFNLIQSNAMQ